MSAEVARRRIMDFESTPARDDALTGLDYECAPHMIASAVELNELFFAADPAERRMIMMNLDYSNGKQSQPMPDAGAASRLEAAALQGRSEEFALELGRALQISHAHAQRVTQDPSGEALVVAAKVLVVPTDALQRILLCINPAIGHSVRRIYNLSALHSDMSIASARQLLAIWQQAAPRARTRSAIERRCATPLHSPSSVRAPPQFRTAGRSKRTRLVHDVVEEMTSTAILDLNDPDVRIKPRFTT